MSRTMLPNSSRAIPKTETVEEPFISETRAMEDPPDEPGAEMTRGARVWKTYVREADRWDKELVEGRNSSLDVLLIFAALFSAISTAFIIESLGDLKPDPAESSAQTLLAVSQTLAAIVNGQRVTLQAQEGSGATAFSPSRSAVAVNVLWLLSLSLSVAVSLVAMLAKDWCYKFMSGRSGPIYEQARRRQEKWNGMERWKMQELLAYLPGAMHLALLLFAAGLCVYLWDININVAVPVIVVTTSATCVYVLATILPLADRFCPYNTPATALLRGFQLVVYLGIGWLWKKIPGPEWLRPSLIQLQGWLRPADHDSDRSITESSNVPMDTVTSQMLAWLITNCEDSRSVDTALQAIAGANASLPHEPLAQCEALYLVVSRLNACVKPDPKSNELTVEALSQLSVALRYSCACLALMSSDSSGTHKDRWNLTTERSYYWPGDSVYSEHTSLLKLLDQKTSDTGMLAIVAAAAAIPLSHWEPREPELEVLGKALDTITSVLGDHFQDGGTRLSPSMLLRLAESSAHHLVSRWPEGERHDSQVRLSILLARVFVTSIKDARDTARAAAITLAAAAFACDTYPGGDKPTLSDDDREKRAVGVLQYYWQRESDEFNMSTLFIFGFFGLLPRLISSAHTTQLAGITHLLQKLVDDYFLGYLLTKNAKIRTLPEQFPLLDHVIKPIYGYLSPAANDSNDKLTLASTCLLPFFRGSLVVQDQRVHLTAVIALCHTESKEHRNLCMEVINWQGLPEAPLERLKSDDDKNLLLHLCRTLLNTHGPVVTVAALHFGLVVANIMSSEGSLSDRQSALLPLLSLGDRPSGGKEPNPLDMGDLLSHLERSAANGSTGASLEYVMQSVVDFCSAGLNLNLGSGAESGDTAPDNVDWRSRLSDLKDGYRPNLGDFEPVGAEGLGDSSPAPGEAEGPIPASGATGTAKALRERDGNAALEMDNVDSS